MLMWLEGLQAGAYYYLTKPFSADTLLAIVAAATRDYRGHKELANEVMRQGRTLACLVQARFVFRTPEEARNLAAWRPMRRRTRDGLYSGCPS